VKIDVFTAYIWCDKSKAKRIFDVMNSPRRSNIGLHGFAPKLAKGEIASLSGAQDDARYFQISVPVQPGNSGLRRAAVGSQHGAEGSTFGVMGTN
jgi:hypothetical protein